MWYLTKLGVVVEIGDSVDRRGYVGVVATCTGRSYGRIRRLSLRLATPLDVERAQAERMEYERAGLLP